MRRTETQACPWCGRVRAINSARGSRDACSSCRYFTQSAPPGEWVELAACRGVDPELFWPDSRETEKVQAAQMVCMGCPVLDECLTYAIETKQNQGIWGGLTPHGRAAYARRLQEAI